MIGFRLDVNERTATGHMRRCLTIAEQLKKRNEACVFLLADAVSLHHMKKYGFRCVLFGGTWDDWEADIPAVSACVRRLGISCLFVDSYQATARFLSELNRIVPVVYLDDFIRQAYDVSMLVCPTQSKRAGRIPNLYQNSNTEDFIRKQVPDSSGRVLSCGRSGFAQKQKDSCYGGRDRSISYYTGDPAGISRGFVQGRISSGCRTWRFEPGPGNDNRLFG